jgi:hypothetical protein
MVYSLGMRVLVAGRNAKTLATTAGAFADDLTIETAATKADCIALLERTEFDLIIACETLGDGSGLEVLSHAAVNTPDTLRIFAAKPSTLNLLQGELGLFGLFRVLPYPINFRKLWAALDLARSCCVESGAGARTANLSQQVQARLAAMVNAGAVAQLAPNAAVGPVRTTAAAGSDTGARAATAAASNGTGTRAASAASARTSANVNNGRAASVASPPGQVQPSQVAAPQSISGSRQAAAASRRNARIPESEAFRRALARRNASKLEADSDISPVDVLGAARQSHGTGERGERRREPAMSNDSLAQLARLTTIRRPTYDSRSTPRGRKRAAIFVGSGVFAAATAAVLTFFMLNENNSMGRSSLPLVASIEHPVPQKIFPWQPAPQQATGMVPVRIESSAAPAAADLEAQAEAESDASTIEPGHPGPPPPNPPPPPSEPPSADSPGWVDE